ncbi:BGTF surface domain-containing protein [Halosimplex pelagicum]|uniref:DUF7827 domain-containing protein n=1 Tax=Halosimplex pelagicum TaxID=869886 RepID=A0A7D5P5A3_9EURY|nr:BGTF surface domain-containing protein [Halosimplex pelagicum]QLH81237.1 hypothetical protein HZS54_06095 [Halosimplex pelagicum]
MITKDQSGAVIFAVLLCLSALSPTALGSSISAQEVDAKIDQNIIQEEIGDVATIPISLTEGSDASLAIYGAGIEYNVTVHDTDSDGNITVYLNTHTFNEGSGGGFSVATGDSLKSVNKSSYAPLAQGRYTLVLSAGSTRQDTSALELQTGRFRDGVLRATPQDVPSNTTAIVKNSHPVDNTVAYGDTAVVEFTAEGINGIANFTNPPGRQQIYTQRDPTGNSSTHTATFSNPSSEMQFSSLSVTYEDRQRSIPELSNANITHFGIDVDDNGQIDRDLQSAISAATISENTISLELSETIELPADGDVLIQYGNITDPDTSGQYPVTVQVGSAVQSGSISYGMAGLGEFGNGVGVDVESTMSTPIVEPMAYQYLSDSNDKVYLLFNTSQFTQPRNATIDVTLWKQTTKGTEAERSRSISTSFRIVNRTATVDVTNKSTWNVSESKAPVSGETTLAPGTEITVELRTEGDSRELLTRYTTVGKNRTFTTQFDLFNQIREGTISIIVKHREERISKIYRLIYN